MRGFSGLVECRPARFTALDRGRENETERDRTGETAVRQHIAHYALRQQALYSPVKQCHNCDGLCVDVPSSEYRCRAFLCASLCDGGGGDRTEQRMRWSRGVYSGGWVVYSGGRGQDVGGGWGLAGRRYQTNMRRTATALQEHGGGACATVVTERSECPMGVESRVYIMRIE